MKAQHTCGRMAKAVEIQGGKLKTEGDTAAHAVHREAREERRSWDTCAAGDRAEWCRSHLPPHCGQSPLT